jgi:hypothetical protein
MVGVLDENSRRSDPGPRKTDAHGCGAGPSRMLFRTLLGRSTGLLYWDGTVGKTECSTCRFGHHHRHHGVEPLEGGAP